jgi:hypothetical protein
MHKAAILAMLLALASGNAAAEWLVAGSTDTTIVYADSATIRREGDRVRILVLLDLKTPATFADMEPFVSTKAEYEYDCKEKRVRGLYYTLHTGHMAEGEVVRKGWGPSDWTPVAPDSLNQNLWNAACGKR